MTVQTLLYLNDTSPSLLTFSDVSGYPPVNYKVKIYRDGQTFARAEYTLQDQANPTSTEYPTMNNGAGLLTFSDGDTFNTNTRVYTFASGTNRFQTSNLGPTDNQIVDPVLTSELFYVDENNKIIRQSKFTKAVGQNGIVVTTDTTRPGEAVFEISNDYVANLPDDITGSTLSISGASTMHAVTATDVTSNSYVFDKVWLDSELANAPKNALLLGVTRVLLNV